MGTVRVRCRGRWRNHSLQVWFQYFQGFQIYRGSKFSFSHWLCCTCWQYHHDTIIIIDQVWETADCLTANSFRTFDIHNVQFLHSSLLWSSLPSYVGNFRVIHAGNFLKHTYIQIKFQTKCNSREYNDYSVTLFCCLVWLSCIIHILVYMLTVWAILFV